MKNITDPIFWLAMVVFLLGTFVAGYYVGDRHLIGGFSTVSSNTKNTSTEINTSNTFIPSNASTGLIKSQQALIEGTFVKVDGNMITIRADDGTEQSFQLASHVSIAPIPTPGQAQSYIPDVNKIPVGQRINAHLELQNGVYVVVLINFLPSK